MSEGHDFRFVDGYWEDPELSRTKGWVSGTLTLLPSGVRYQLYLVTPLRLQQDASAEFARGRPFYAEPNMIVIADITSEGVLSAVREIVRDQYTGNLCEDSPTIGGPA